MQKVFQKQLEVLAQTTARATAESRVAAAVGSEAQVQKGIAGLETELALQRQREVGAAKPARTNAHQNGSLYSLRLARLPCMNYELGCFSNFLNHD